MADLFSNVYNPDVLSCLANLSNDEVFTPPEIVNKMLDMLPQELFSNPDTTFLDPACKTGVFLREIAVRLIKGLAKQIPDLQERLDHIFHKQLYGIAITELTSLLSRRGIYCSKYPNSEFSVSKFDDAQGNIRFKRIEHTWKDGKCIFCSANQEQYERGELLETHAYEFIHTYKTEEIFKMKFDVIIGNPPYQLSTGGGQAQATPLYDKFVLQAAKLNPRYLCMIIPARWYAGGFPCIKDFRTKLTTEQHVKEIHDFPNASDCFSGVEIKGGVCYFLWEKDYVGDCKFVNHSGNLVLSESSRPLIEDKCETVIRNNNAISILHKVLKKHEASFSDMMGTLWPFTVKSSFDTLTSTKQEENDIFAYVMKNKGWIRKSEITKNTDIVNGIKLFVPRSVGSADPSVDRVKPILALQNTCCSGTYIVCGPFENEQYAKNVEEYFNTRFFHFLLSLKKVSQDTAKGCYEFIPQQDFSRGWTDEDLYHKYELTEDEIRFIEATIWPQ